MNIKIPNETFYFLFAQSVQNLVRILHSQNLSSDAKFSAVKVKCGSAKTMKVLVNTNILHFWFLKLNEAKENKTCFLPVGVV